ncbi:MAG TPA: FHA domain-containing protein [Myxococcota bacterium]|nr:FHA domain-containing protein [Myxococcota bacterium]HRY94792.1 FHA domain-containing protein [Myxococcota bacterium]
MKLTLVDSSGRERVVELTTKPQVFGRGEDSDVVLGSRSVSRHHMKCWLDGAKVMVEDLTGGVGIKVDGAEITGTFELEPGAEMQVGVFTVTVPGGRRGTASDLAPIGEAKATPTLFGTRGATKGLEIELQEGDNDVGRDPHLYLVIDDASVSRQHARLTVRGDSFRVVDMRSSNGTFLNGKRVEQADVVSGDLVRFGNLEFKFVCGKETSKGAKARKKKLMLLGVGGGLILLLFLGVAAKKCSAPPPEDMGGEDVDTGGVDIENEKERLMRAAKAALDEEPMDLKAAMKYAQEGLALDPIDKEFRRLKVEIEDESAAKSIFDQCVIEFDLNRWQVAYDCFRKLPDKSRFAKKAKYKVAECAKQLSNYHRTEGKSYETAGQLSKAHDHYVDFMRLNPCDKEVYKRLQGVERKAKGVYGLKIAPFTWTCEDGQVLAPGSEGVDPEDAIKQKYPNALASAVLKYHQGRLQPAMQELQKLGSLSRDRGLAEKARELLGYMRVVYGKYNEGVSSINRMKAAEAKAQFDQALLTDARIMPEGVTSFYREDIGKQMGLQMYKDGLEYYNRKSFVDAFKSWSDCLQRAPGETSCANGLLQLEQEAEEAFAEVDRLEAAESWQDAGAQLKFIQSITRPESLAYKRAEKRLREYEQE